MFVCFGCLGLLRREDINSCVVDPGRAQKSNSLGQAYNTKET